VSTRSGTGNLRDVGGRRRQRDPSGKAALFSHGATPLVIEEEPPAPSVVAEPEHRRLGTLVVECSACDTRSRVSYLDFMLMNLPVGVWLPLPGLEFNRRMTCPACGQWTWLQAHWFE
jgi:hypothetical protein